MMRRCNFPVEFPLTHGQGKMPVKVLFLVMQTAHASHMIPKL